MNEVQITLTFNPDRIRTYADEYLATLWHLAQANPVPHGDHDAGELAEKIGREIIRRWLRGVEPQMYTHQGRDYYWSELCKVATYEPGGESGTPEWRRGRWVPKDAGEGDRS